VADLAVVVVDVVVDPDMAVHKEVDMEAALGGSHKEAVDILDTLVEEQPLIGFVQANHQEHPSQHPSQSPVTREQFQQQ
jgi:hypothetical protein